MRHAAQFFLIALTLMLSAPRLHAADAPSGHSAVATRSTANLKQYMSSFGSMLASLEILQMKEKKPDWAAIEIAVDDLSKTLSQLQKADVDNAYKEYTDVLAAGMIELKDKSSKKDKTFFNSVDKLTETCFKCHAAHRPGDYLVPKDGKERLSKDGSVPEPQK